MKNAIKTQSNLAKLMVAASFFALGCTAVGAKPLADRPVDSAAPADNVTFPVRFSDLDLSKIKDAKILYLRIRYAAQTVCQNDATWSKQDGDACMHKAMYDAVARVNSPLLSQYYQLRSKGDKAGLAQLAKAN